MNIPDLSAFTNKRHSLSNIGTWRESVHVFDERSAQAIRAALAAGRPLLVRGEPGTGKSQLARAAAKVLQRRFLSQVIDAHTEIQDLWYRFDAVSRLGNAQVLSVSGKPEDIKTELDPQKYLSPGILWWAFAWGNAKKQKCDFPLFKPEQQEHIEEKNGVVLLLDEIDKADADLPNSLLETLDNGKFTVPWIHESVGFDARGETPRPLVVITTNEDRQLPGAFVRRCLVLDLSLPEKETDLIEHLEERAVHHFPESEGMTQEEADQEIKRDANKRLLAKSRFDERVLTEVAKQLYQDRQQADALGVTPPGQAEYLDILRVLDRFKRNEAPEEQLALLREIQDFSLKKYPGMQRREDTQNAAEVTEKPQE